MLVIKKNKLVERKIFNMDETWIYTVQQPATSLVPKDQKEVSAVISYKRRTT